MPRRKLPTPPRLSNTGYVAVYKNNDDKLLISKRLTGELQDKYSACDDWQLSACPLCRPERRSPQWTQSSTPRGFTISSPLSCHSLHVWQGAQRHVGKEGQVGSRAGEEMWRREKKNPSRGWITKVLRWLCITLPHPFSLLIPPFVSLSLYQWGATLCS